MYQIAPVCQPGGPCVKGALAEIAPGENLSGLNYIENCWLSQACDAIASAWCWPALTRQIRRCARPAGVRSRSASGEPEVGE